MKHVPVSKMKVFFSTVVIVCCLLITTAGAEWKGTVRGGWLILRSSPSFQGKQISSYPTGTVVTITAQHGSWYAVITPDGLKGFMLGNYLKVTGGKKEEGLKPGQEAWVTSKNGLNVRLRTGPGTQYPALASYAPGTKCEILEKVGTFYRIRIGKYTGYMMGKYLTGKSPEKIMPTEGYTVHVISRNGQGVNLRTGPSTSYPSIGLIPVGTKATMISSGKTWSRISINGLEGYMMSVYLTRETPRVSGQEHAHGEFYVYHPSGEHVNLRKGPGFDYETIGSYASGTEVNVLTTEGEWYFVKIKSTYGFMLRKYIVSNGSEFDSE